MKPRAVMFDIDGTIVSLDLVVRCFQEVCRILHTRMLTRKEIMEKAVSYKLSESVPRMLPEVDWRKFQRCFEEVQVKNYKMYGRVLPHVKATFNFLCKSGIRIGIVTTKIRSEALANLKGYDLPFDYLVSGSDVKERKPSPKPVLKACEGLGLMPKDCLFVGDHPFDMQAAVAAGCTPIGTLTGWGNRKNLKIAGAKYVIRDLSGLKKIIGDKFQ